LILNYILGAVAGGTQKQQHTTHSDLIGHVLYELSQETGIKTATDAVKDY